MFSPLPQKIQDAPLKGDTSESVQCYMINRHIDWQFIVEKGPWWGGRGGLGEVGQECQAFLKKTIGRAMLTFDEMAILIVEIKNYGPLTYV